MKGFFASWREDLPASLVVFLVALPLCMGIALASGVPPALGLVTGIVGGLVVGFLSGAPLQVSGPAAGLTVLVFDLVQHHGLAALGAAVFLGGIVQLAAGALGLGRWFRAVSPAVIQGMLAGIGVLIFASQLHVLIDDKPAGSGLENLLTIPGAVVKAIAPSEGSVHHLAALVGIVSVASLVLWEKLRPERLRVVPGPLVAVIVATAVVAITGLPIDRVSVPSSFGDILAFPQLSLLASPALIGSALALAFIASAETLLCAVAVDKLHDGPRSNLNKELFAQGVGNTICGLVGALPMTGVIVRSSANIQAGGKTRLSAVLHGLWLLVFVAALPFVLSWVPTTALAAVLVVIGAKLAHPRVIKALARHGPGEVLIFLATVGGIVGVNLLFGVLLGFALSLVRMLFGLGWGKLRSAGKITVQVDAQAEGPPHVTLRGVASFLTLPKLAEALESMPADRSVVLRGNELIYLDSACLELMESWNSQATRAGGGVVGGKDKIASLAAPEPMAAVAAGDVAAVAAGDEPAA